MESFCPRAFRIRLSSSLLTHQTSVRYSVIVLIALTFILHIENGSAIKCWVCRSDGDPKCADPFDNTSFPIADCKGEDPRKHLPGLESTMCRKVRQKVNGNWRYIRSCAWLGEPGIGRDERYCIHRSGTYNIHVEYCTCRSKDGCNTGNNLEQTSSIPMLFMISITFCMNLFWR